MKILIWLVFCVVVSLFQGLLRDSGILLGALPTIALYLIFYIPADILCDAWDVKKYEKKFPGNVVEHMCSIVDAHKRDFLLRKNFNIQDDGIGFFEIVKDKITLMKENELKKIMICIVKNESSPSFYVLELLENELIEKMKFGDIKEIMNQSGETYTITKIYEYINDIQLENGALTPIQYKNKLKNIEYYVNSK